MIPYLYVLVDDAILIGYRGDHAGSDHPQELPGVRLLKCVSLINPSSWKHRDLYDLRRNAACAAMGYTPLGDDIWVPWDGIVLAMPLDGEGWEGWTP